MHQSMQLVLEGGSIDKPLNFDVCCFDTAQFSYQCVHLIHAKVFSIQMLPHFSRSLAIDINKLLERLVKCYRY